MSDLEVIGGAGGLEVGVEDLRRGAAALRRGAAVIEDALGPDWEVAPWLLARSPPGVAAQLLRVWSESAELRRRVGVVLLRLRDLAGSTALTADRYEAAEERARSLVGAVHDQHRHADLGDLVDRIELLRQDLEDLLRLLRARL